MPDQQYTNPFGLYADVNPVPQNPFWSGMMGARNQMTAQPFIDMMEQSQGLDLMKKGMETGEFMGQEAQGVRSQQRRAAGAESQFKIDTLPNDAKLRNEQTAQELRSLPYMTDQKIEQAKLATQNAKAAPQRELLSELGQLHEPLSQASPQERPFMYLSAIERWKQTHPGVDVPPQFRMYNDSILPDLAAIRYAQIYTPEQVGKERQIRLQGDEAMRRARLEGNDKVRTALIGYDTHVDTAEAMRERSRETPPQAVARLRRELTAKPDQPEKIDELRYHMEDQWNTEVQRDPGLAVLRMQAMTAEDPKRREELMSRYDDQRWSFFAEKGIYLPRKFKGKTWRYTGSYGGNWKDQKNWKPE